MIEKFFNKNNKKNIENKIKIKSEEMSKSFIKLKNLLLANSLGLEKYFIIIKIKFNDKISKPVVNNINMINLIVLIF